MRYGFLFALFKPSRNYLRGFLIAAWAGDKIAEFSFPEISFHFPLRPCFFFVSPAYAGKSLMTRLFLNRNWDHPRACGEKGTLYRRATAQMGSPPRMRGKAEFFDVTATFDRITPRVCGEKLSKVRQTDKICGSPPRMRGKACSCIRCMCSEGITPAYAGKS